MGWSHLTRPGRALATLAIAGMAASWIGAIPVVAASGLTVTTPFPSVSVQPGATVTFEVMLSDSASVRADLSLEGVPHGWSASLSGGGNEIGSAYVTAGTPTHVTLDVQVAADAQPGTQSMTLVATSGGDTARLRLDVTIASTAGGTVSLESDYPSLQGSVDQDFKFNLTLSNNTPQQLTFDLSAQGPAGWDISIQPADEAKAASVTVAARATQRLEVTATPAQDATTATYPVTATVAAGSYTASAQLGVVVTGRVDMNLTTPDQRLNTTANAGAAKDFQVTVENNGTSPLQGVTLSATAPSDWQVTFDPTTVQQVAANQASDVTAHITPSGNAVAGDYVVTIKATTQSATKTMDVRVTVETPPIWGFLGIALIVATLAGLVWVFRRYGRR